MGTDAPLFDADSANAAQETKATLNVAPTPTLLWCRDSQRPLGQALAKHANLLIVTAGSPERGLGLPLAEALDAEHADDLRAGLAAAGAGDDTIGVVLILDSGSFGKGSDDAAALQSAATRGVRTLSLDPVPASALELTEPWIDGHEGSRAVDTLRLGAMLSRLPALAEAMEQRDAFGPIRAASVELCIPPTVGSLGGQLCSALDCLIGLFGPVETLDAAHTGPRSASGLLEAPGETLRGVHGEIGMTLRFADGQLATALLSDRGGAWSRSLTLLGDGGRMHITDLGFDWFSPEGTLLDSHRAPIDNQAADADLAVTTLSRDLQSLVQGTELGLRLGKPAIDPAPVLAAAQAALLSCRTGQAEHPATITRLMHR